MFQNIEIVTILLFAEVLLVFIFRLVVKPDQTRLVRMLVSLFYGLTYDSNCLSG